MTTSREQIVGPSFNPPTVTLTYKFHRFDFDEYGMNLIKIDKMFISTFIERVKGQVQIEILLTPARRNTSTIITSSISSVPEAKIAKAVFVAIF